MSVNHSLILFDIHNNFLFVNKCVLNISIIYLINKHSRHKISCNYVNDDNIDGFHSPAVTRPVKTGSANV